MSEFWRFYELFSCFILFIQIPCQNLTTDHLMKSRIEFPQSILLLSTHYNNYQLLLLPLINIIKGICQSDGKYFQAILFFLSFYRQTLVASREEVTFFPKTFVQIDRFCQTSIFLLFLIKKTSDYSSLMFRLLCLRLFKFKIFLNFITKTYFSFHRKFK